MKKSPATRSPSGTGPAKRQKAGLPKPKATGDALGQADSGSGADADPENQTGEASDGQDTAAAVEQAVAWLREVANEAVRDGMARFGIPSDHALGVTVGEIQNFAKPLGHNHALSQALWATGIYEARHLAVFVGDPAVLTPEGMDRWCADFDNWAVCDAACFHLFDRSPHAFSKIPLWAAESGEFQKRAGFALLAALALHHRTAPDADFLTFLPLIESCSGDDRNFVKKAVNWALRAIGGRSLGLHAAALETAQRRADSQSPAARWIGKDALRQLNAPATLKRLASRTAKAEKKAK